MKYFYATITAVSFAAAALASTETVTLNEAEKLVSDGKAVIIKIPNSAFLAQIKDDDANKTKAVDTNATVEVAAAQKPKEEPVKAAMKPKMEPKAEKPRAGVDIAMPITLSSLLNRLAALSGESYYCEDEINIPPAKIKITDIGHLDRYLKQVTPFGLKVTRDSQDPSIPKVLKVIRTEDKGGQK